MTIIAPLPFTLTNGTTADASEVMANLDQIRNDVNSNSAAIISQGGVAPYKGAFVTNVFGNFQTMPFIVPTPITFNSEYVDTDNIHSNTYPSRLIVPAGVSLVRLTCSIQTTEIGSADFVYTIFQKNGISGNFDFNTYAQKDELTPAFSASLKNTRIATCVPGDYFEVAVSMSNADSAKRVVIGQNSQFEMQILG